MARKTFSKRGLVRPQALLLVLGVLPGCAFFSGKPPLPKHASIERLGKPAMTDFAALVENADVIYFPRERAVSGGKSEPAALFIEALQKSGKSFAIGWDLIDATEQPLLNELPLKSNGPREELIAALELTGTGRTREHCRSVLREVRLPYLHHLALRSPASLIAAATSSDRLSADEEKLLPRGYASPPGGLEAYSERLLGNRGLQEQNLTSAYRAELVRLQFAAEKIVRYFRDAEAGARLLVFASESDLDTEQGIPFYVAQKLRVRQLVLGSEAPRKERARLLTLQRGRAGSGFEIVDRAPLAALD